MNENKIDKVIICNPYEEPKQHLKYEDERYIKTEGRRPAGYRVMDEDGNYGNLIPINSVNYIREKVDAWRKDNYEGITNVTRDLLEHWKSLTDPRLFFCQIEAIETIIYINEINPEILDETPEFKSDCGEFIRQCAKMATGTGKTIVMGMLIAWQILNANDGYYKRNYSKDILIVSPSLIVLDRLKVLNPGKNSIYEDFSLIPNGYKLTSGSMNLKITNWHKLKQREKPNHASHDQSEVEKEKESTFAKRIMGKQCKNILVINDEGHHAFRPDNLNLANRLAKKEGQIAGVWMNGLDMVHKNHGIKTCFDFTATPFVSTGRSLLDDKLFTWIISDFSLDDAVESGLIKTPRPVRSDKSELKKYSHIYRNKEVSDALNNGFLHKDVKHAYKLLGEDWKETNKAWKKDSDKKTQPVLITICNETKHAELIKDRMKKNAMMMPGELCDDESILHIDSRIAKRIEEGKEEKGDYTLREKASTVGKPGEPGEKINNIISVNMLTEGWDVKTVTHIMGLRAFSSQLLCEQVIGRGLRRTSYDVESNGLFKKEPVTILGVPFGFLPSDGEVDSPSDNTAPKIITMLSERNEHKISWPIVDEINNQNKYSWTLDDNLQPYESTDDIVDDIELGTLLEGRSELHDGSLKYDGSHIQEVEFGVLQSMFIKQLNEKWEIRNQDVDNRTPYKDVIVLLDLIGKFLKNNVITELNDNDLIKSLLYQRDDIAKHLLKNILETKESIETTDIKRRGSTENRKTRFTRSKHVCKTKKTHLDKMSGSNPFELNIGKFLDKNPNVLSWIKADMVRFNIRYQNAKNQTKYYRPDFIVHLKNGIQLILEGKGEEREDVKYKTKATEKWVRAVNNDNKWGKWQYAIIKKIDDGNDWNDKLNDILKENCTVDHTCVKCNKNSKTSKEATNSFKVYNDDGILRYDNICKDCTLKIL